MLKRRTRRSKYYLQPKDRVFIGMAICLFVVTVAYGLYVGIHHKGHHTSAVPAPKPTSQILEWPAVPTQHPERAHEATL